MIADWCPECRRRTSLYERGVCLWCDTRLVPRRQTLKPNGGGGVALWIPEADLRTLHRAYVAKGMSLRALGARVKDRYGYSSVKSCANAIQAGWKKLGLPRRDRVAALQLKLTTHGMTPRRHRDPDTYNEWRRGRWHEKVGLRPPCKGVRVSPPRGAPCQKPAMNGSEYCRMHDPAFAEQRAVELDAMRRARRTSSIPEGPDCSQEAA